jgi:hypothetical protein
MRILQENQHIIARQLSNGKWTSKLGQDEDIEHENLEGLVGEIYGSVVCIMKKTINRNS